MTRRFLVYPSRMIYYFTLSQASLNSALHNQNNSYVHGWSLSRFNFFLVVSGAMFVYVRLRRARSPPVLGPL